MSTQRSTQTLGLFGNIHLARGETLVDRGSSFVAWVAWPVKSEAAATAAVALLRQQEAAADHIMTAFRVELPSGKKKKVAKGYDDDGEAHGGQRLLGCLTAEKVVDAAVVVARVWGGVNLGKARFDHIQERARTLLRAVGHQAGEGIRHDWGEGQALGGGGSGGGGSGSGVMPGQAASSASASSGDASSARKRKRPAEPTAAQRQDEVAATREAMAAAAERRLSMLQP